MLLLQLLQLLGLLAHVDGQPGPHHPAGIAQGLAPGPRDSIQHPLKEQSRRRNSPKSKEAEADAAPRGVLVSVPPEGCGLPVGSHSMHPHLCAAPSLCPPTGRSVLTLLTHVDFLSSQSSFPTIPAAKLEGPHHILPNPEAHFDQATQNPPSFQCVEEPDAICRAADLDDIFPGQLQQVCTCRSHTTGRAWSSAQPLGQSPATYSSPHASGNEPRSSQAVLLCSKYKFPTICARQWE